jgi:hypothetical protein
MVKYEVEENEIEFRYTRDGETISMTTHVDVNSVDLTELFGRFMLAVGYSPNSVKEALNEDE